jgi:hypothetical protein
MRYCSHAQVHQHGKPIAAALITRLQNEQEIPMILHTLDRICGLVQHFDYWSKEMCSEVVSMLMDIGETNYLRARSIQSILLLEHVRKDARFDMIKT